MESMVAFYKRLGLQRPKRTQSGKKYSDPNQKMQDAQNTRGYVKRLKRQNRDQPGWFWYRAKPQELQHESHRRARQETKQEIQAQLAEMAQDQLELDAAEALMYDEVPFMTDAFGFCHEEDYYDDPNGDFDTIDEDGEWGDFLVAEEPEELPAARYTIIGIDMASGPDVTVFRNPCAEVALPGVDLCQFVYTPEIRWVYKHEGD